MALLDIGINFFLKRHSQNSYQSSDFYATTYTFRVICGGVHSTSDKLKCEIIFIRFLNKNHISNDVFTYFDRLIENLLVYTELPTNSN